VNLGVALTDAIPGNTGDTVDEVVRLVREAAWAGLGSAWLGQRLDYDSVALAGIAGAVRDYFEAGATEVIFTQTSLLGAEARLRACGHP
jgi:hypothetical protein